MRQIARTARITGHVQGVAFRAWTQGRARHLGLVGWVRNNGDGSVSAHLQGPEAQVEQLINELWTGPGAASVTNVQVETTDSDAALKGFDILR